MNAQFLVDTLGKLSIRPAPGTDIENLTFSDFLDRRVSFEGLVNHYAASDNSSAAVNYAASTNKNEGTGKAVAGGPNNKAAQETVIGQSVVPIAIFEQDVPMRTK